MSKFEPRNPILKNGQTLLLREAVPDDAEKILAYLNQVGGESDNLLFGENGFPMPLEREQAFLGRMAGEEKSIFLVGFVGEELVTVASVDALTARERVAHRAGVSVTVRKAYWGQGVGRAVMEALIGFGKSQGLEVLQLEVRSDNTRAVSLYEKLGFEKMGLYRNFMKVNGHPADAWYMNLYLQQSPLLRFVEEKDLDACLSVIHSSFATVAKEFELTQQNCPTHTSFLPMDRFRRSWEDGETMGCLEHEGKLVGFVSLKPEGEGVFELKHLAVLPEFRHRGYGEKLVEWARKQTSQEGGTLLKAGIIGESKVLKDWYCGLGFREVGTKTFPHLPFTVAFLEATLA